MAGSSWTAWFRIRDQGAQATLGSLTDGANKLSEVFGGKLMKSFNTFNLMKDAIEAVVKGAQELVNESKEIVTMSTRFDIPIEKLGALRNVAKSFGMDANGLGGALQSLEKSINNAITRPGMEASRTFTKLGISQEEVQSMSGRTDLAFIRLRKALRGLADEGERNAAINEAFPGNAEAVIDVLKRNEAQFQAAEDAAYEYSDSLTKNNSDTLDALNDINEDMKPIYQFVAAIGGFVVQLLAFIVQGLKIAVKLIVDVVMGAIEVIQGGITMAVEAVAWGFKSMYYKGKNALGLMSDESLAAKQKELEVEHFGAIKSAGKIVEKGGDRLTAGVSDKDARDMTRRSMKLDSSLAAVGESLGMESATDAGNREVEMLKEQVAEFQKLSKERIKDIDKKRKDGKDTKEEVAALLALEEDIAKKKKEIFTIEETMRINGTKKQDKGISGYTSNEIEDFREVDRLKKKELEYEAKRIALGSQPKIFKDALELQIAGEKRLQAQKELARLELAGLSVEEKQAKIQQLAADGVNMTSNDLAGISTKRDEKSIKEKQNKVLEAKNAEAKIAQDMTNDALTQNKQITDAERDRNLAAIEGVRERQRFADKQKGVSAIDQQSSELKYQIENLQREQEKLDKMNANPQTTAAERQKQEDAVQKQTFGAAGAMDKLMAMQYNFVASSAAKSGMGGGISETTNLIDINKEQLNYLKKMYEAMLGKSGQEGQSFQYYPLNLQGRNVRD